ncbi:MAG: ABC transporter substrate-binding protein [Acidimicrobiales bacterium]
MRTVRKAFACALAPAALALAAAACGGGGGGDEAAATTPAPTTTTPDDLAKVTLRLPGPISARFAGYLAAQRRGLYREAGLDVELVPGEDRTDPTAAAAAAVAGGEADFAVDAAASALAARERTGADLVAVAQVFERSGGVHVSLASARMRSAADLRGKRVGAVPGADVELRAGLRKAGLDPAKDVTLVPQKDLAALLRGELDAVQAERHDGLGRLLATVNTQTKKQVQLAELGVLSWQEQGVGVLGDGIWTDGRRLRDDAKRRDVAVRLVAASLEGWAVCRDEPDACVEAALEDGVDLGASLQAWQLNEVNALIWPAGAAAGAVDQQAFDRTVEQAVAAGVLKTRPPAGVVAADVAKAAQERLAPRGVDLAGARFAPQPVVVNPGGQ